MFILYLLNCLLSLYFIATRDCYLFTGLHVSIPTYTGKGILALLYFFSCLMYLAFLWSCLLHFPCVFRFIFQCLNANKPRHDKTKKVTVCPAKTLISLGIAVRSVGTKDQRFLHADSKDSDQTRRMPRLI